MRWYIDGQLYQCNSFWFSDNGPYPAPFDVPFHMLINLAVGGNLPGPVDPAALARVFSVILERKAGRGMTNREGKSYVRSLLDAGAPKIGRKINEEAGELADAFASTVRVLGAEEGAAFFERSDIRSSEARLFIDGRPWLQPSADAAPTPWRFAVPARERPGR